MGSARRDVPINPTWPVRRVEPALRYQGPKKRRHPFRKHHTTVRPPTVYTRIQLA
ncbi:MAG: hypothetical protein MI923_06355 [Phycisphaerales bacterium]|nr:hypothetical protein [Phycisphaerales bacterium]